MGDRRATRREPPGCRLLAVGLTVMSAGGCAWSAPPSTQAATAAPSTASPASLPLGLPRAPDAPQPTVWGLPDEEPLAGELLAPLVVDDTAPLVVDETAEPLAVDNTSAGGGIYARPMRPEPLDHVCPSGTAPYAEVTKSRAEPAPGYGERPDSYGHRFLITAAGRVHNGTTGDVSLNVSLPIAVTVDGGGTRLDEVRVIRTVPARGSQSWTASGYYTHYGDASYWRPRLSTAVERWTWTDYRDRNCPR
jgi:hypothetical protein